VGGWEWGAKIRCMWLGRRKKVRIEFCQAETVFNESTNEWDCTAISFFGISSKIGLFTDFTGELLLLVKGSPRICNNPATCYE